MAADPRIKHVVVLMLENRSFDHMLGLLKAENAQIRGFAAGDYSNLTTAGASVGVSDGAVYQGQLDDPGHEFGDVFMQMYGAAAGQPVGAPDMSGFAKSYEQQVGAGKGGDVMRCFRPDQLPALAGLARSYTICDAWFSSVPGPTLPNRAFAHFGTSFGRLDMSPDYFRAEPSIYQRLKQAATPQTGRIYYFDSASSTQGLTFLLSDQSDYFAEWADFKDDCKHNRLPEYSFIEPNYKDHDGLTACDQHPDNDVRAGDSFIREVYQAIRQKDEVWKSTLLLIVWDEHGGLFDHETPPAVNHTDGFVSTSPPFDFDRLGVRVPAVVVSPYVDPGTVSHIVFEHASIPATVTEQFIGDPKIYSPFDREKWAPTLLQLLTRTTARMDTPTLTAGQHAMAMTAAAPQPPPAPRPNAPVSSLLTHQLAEVLAELKRHHPRVAATLDPKKVKTHQAAADFMKRAMAVLNPPRPRTPPRPKPKRRVGRNKK